MKYTHFGYNQAIAVELGLNLEDLCLLRWLEDFINTGKMQTFDVDGQTYFWVKYDYVIKQLPIIASDKRKITAKLKRLVDLNLLDFCLLRKSGNYSLYKLNEENHKKLIVDTEKCIHENDKNVLQETVKPFTENGERVLQESVKGITENCETLLQKNVKPFTENCETNINLSKIHQSNNSSSKNNSTKDTQATTLGDIENFINASIESEQVRKSIFQFIEHRRDMQKPMNANVVRLFIDKLKKHTDDKKVELINDAIINGWKDIYPKDDYSNSRKSSVKQVGPELSSNTSYDLKAVEDMWNNIVPRLI